MLKKLMEKLKCSPLTCLSLYIAILAIFAGSIKADYSQLRQEISKIYEVLLSGREIARNCPVEPRSFYQALESPYSLATKTTREKPLNSHIIQAYGEHKG